MAGTQPTRHHRRSIRLPGFDYASPGAYFVTICVHGGECFLGEVVDGEMRLNAWGQIALEEWLASEEIRHELDLDAFVVMPNHIHGIVWISARDSVEAHGHGSASVGAHGNAPSHPDVNRAPAHADADRAHRRAPLPDDAPAHVDGNAAPSRDTAPVGAHGNAPSHPDPPSHADADRAHGRAPLPNRAARSLGSFIAGYKAAVTKRINQLRDTPGLPFWQRDYWEHVIRDEESLNRIRAYIESNPARWDQDQLHPAALPNPFNRWPS
jgi:putative transposase